MRSLPDHLWTWRSRFRDSEVLFVGRGSRQLLPADLPKLLPAGIEPAWLEQIHSARVVEAAVGSAGRADAILTDRADLGLAIITADCVPVLLTVGSQIAAIHAGWRGIADRIVPKTIERMAVATEQSVAWVGPAIGPCCYEVGEEVAAAVCKASCSTVKRPGSGARPHLDLAAAVRAQLEEYAIFDIRQVGLCTRCQGNWLWSYRREGAGTGRNLALIWKYPGAAIRD